MIRSRLFIDTAPLDELEAFLTSFSDVVVEVGEAALDEVRPHLLDELRYYPGPVQYPIDWQTEKQRRAFFATDGFGQGIPTRRTGELAAAWAVEGETTAAGFAIVVTNRKPSARFVVGSLAKARQAASRFQQRMHANTGWPLATDTVAFWFEAAQERFQARLAQRIASFRRRGVTTPLRR